jgi:hypothetical protein
MAQGASIWGQYVTLPYKHLTMWEAYKMSIPFAWLDWFIMTFAVSIGDKYELVTPTQDTFLLIIIQFCLVLIMNQYYLKQKVTRSDLIAFGIILVGFCVSFFNLISKIIYIDDKDDTEFDNPDRVPAFLKSRKYNVFFEDV